MEVVFEGVLEVSKSSSPKGWKPCLFVLKKHTDAQRSTLDYYKDTKKRWQKQVAKGVVSLWPWFTVSIAHSCSYKFTIKLITSEQTLFLAANSLGVMNKWLYHIQTQRLLDPPKRGCYVFSVQAQDSDFMNVIGVRGDCLLSLSTELEIQCALFPSKQVVAVWPFETLRRYWYGDGLFGFEAGRRSPRGEGKYIFVTSQDKEIYKTLAYFIKKAKRDSVTSSSSNEYKDLDTRPPAPIPADTNKYETPIPSSESEEEQQNEDNLKAAALGYDSVNTPPCPPKAKLSPSSKRRSMGNIRVENVDVSTTSPAYLRRVRTHMGFSPQWLHESVKQPQNQATETPTTQGDIPPAALVCEEIQARDPQEEDTYSHTVHLVPAPFRLQSTEPSAVGASLYNAVVHKNAPTIRGKGRPSSEDDNSLYDIAYQVNPKKGGRGVLPKAESQYDTAYLKDGNVNLPRTTMPVSKMPLGPQPTGRPAEPLPQPELQKLNLERKESDDGLTVNPLYGSQENLLTDLTALEDSTEATDGGGQKQAANPVYGKPTGIVVGPRQGTSNVAGSEDPNSVNASQNPGIDSPGGSLVHRGRSPTPIQRDGKGYSKVDKSKKNGHQESSTQEEEKEEEEEDGVAPPLPERNYSFEGNS